MTHNENVGVSKENFVFQSSWWNALASLPRAIQGEVLTAIVEYGLNGVTTESLKPTASALFALIRPQIDSNNQRIVKQRVESQPTDNPGLFPLSEILTPQRTEALCRQLKTTPEEIMPLAQAIHTNWSATGQQHSSLKDAYYHMLNMLTSALAHHRKAQQEISISEAYSSASYERDLQNFKKHLV